jgi:hypothetical protein
VRRTPHDGSERLITQAELLKLQENGQFPDESEKIYRITSSEVLPTTGKIA